MLLRSLLFPLGIGYIAWIPLPLLRKLDRMGVRGVPAMELVPILMGSITAVLVLCVRRMDAVGAATLTALSCGTWLGLRRLHRHELTAFHGRMALMLWSIGAAGLWAYCATR